MIPYGPGKLDMYLRTGVRVFFTNKEVAGCDGSEGIEAVHMNKDHPVRSAAFGGHAATLCCRSHHCLEISNIPASGDLFSLL